MPMTWPTSWPICNAYAGSFASKPAPTFDRDPSEETQLNVGAGLLAKGA
jgi:hypothetical protein